jgi:hypothetical protein
MAPACTATDAGTTPFVTAKIVFAPVKGTLLHGFFCAAFCVPFALGSVPALPAIFSAETNSLAAHDSLDDPCAAASVAANPPTPLCPKTG